LENDDLGGSAGNEFGERSRAQPPADDERYIGMFHTSNRNETNGDTTLIQSTLNIAQITTA
jgi:hypothetical protein